MTEQTTSPYTGRPVVEWFDEKITLRDVNGDRVGELVEINPDFLIAESDGGFLGLGERHHYYVPRASVTREEGSDWYLSITKEEAESQDWRQPPQESTYTGGDWRAEYDTAATASTTTDTDTTSVIDVASAPARAERTRLVTHEEQLQARAVAHQAGEVAVRKEVVEDVQTIEVPVRREEVVVERHAVTGDAADDGTAFQDVGETLRVPVMEEQVEVNKVVRPVEEIEVSKRVVEGTQSVSDTVRRETIKVEGDEEVLSEVDRARATR